MNKNRLFIVGGLLLLLIIVGFTVWFLTSDSSKDEKNAPKEKNEQKAEPALTREKDEKTEEQDKIDDENKRQQEEQRESDKAKKDKDKKDIEKQNVDSLKQDAEFVLTKTITGKSDSDEKKLSETATQEFTTNIPSTEEQDGDKKQVEIKNLKLDLGKKPDMKSDKLKGTLQFDLIIKPKKGSDIKPITQIDSKRSITFEREDKKLKVNELRS